MSLSWPPCVNKRKLTRAERDAVSEGALCEEDYDQAVFGREPEVAKEDSMQHAAVASGDPYELAEALGLRDMCLAAPSPVRSGLTDDFASLAVASPDASSPKAASSKDDAPKEAAPLAEKKMQVIEISDSPVQPQPKRMRRSSEVAVAQLAFIRSLSQISI